MRLCHPEALEGCLVVEVFNWFKGFIEFKWFKGLIFPLVILEKLALQFYSESILVQV